MTIPWTYNSVDYIWAMLHITYENDFPEEVVRLCIDGTGETGFHTTRDISGLHDAFLLSPLYPPRPLRPSNWHTIWDDVNNKWLPNAGFTDALAEEMRVYRDEQILADTGTSVDDVTTYKFESDEWVVDDEDLTFSLSINERTKTALVSICTALPIVNEDAVISFKFEEGYAKVKGETMQRALVKVREREQIYFNAEEHVMSEHANTPFDSVQEAKDAFDLYTGA